MSSPARGRTWTLVFLVALAAQLVAVYAPSAPSEGGVPYLDKLVHLTIFAVPVAAGLLAGWPPVLVLGGFVGHAVLSEFLQSAVLPHRDGGWTDALADIVGVALGAALAVALRRRGDGERRAGTEGAAAADRAGAAGR